MGVNAQVFMLILKKILIDQSKLRTTLELPIVSTLIWILQKFTYFQQFYKKHKMVNNNKLSKDWFLPILGKCSEKPKLNIHPAYCVRRPLAANNTAPLSLFPTGGSLTLSRLRLPPLLLVVVVAAAAATRGWLSRDIISSGDDNQSWKRFSYGVEEGGSIRRAGVSWRIQHLPWQKSIILCCTPPNAAILPFYRWINAVCNIVIELHQIGKVIRKVSWK